MSAEKPDPQEQATRWWDQGVDGRDQLLGAYRDMVVIRVFEEEMQRLFAKGIVEGTTHLCIGQEAVSVGASAALDGGDYVAATYRGHGHALARGVAPESLAAELLGRATGTCGGRAGSMNVIALERGLVGCFGIVGGSIATAIGAGISAQRQGRVAVAFFGDGAANQAYFAECLNFAQVFALPVVFICENNLYGEYTPMAQVTAGGDIAARAVVYGMTASKVDGNDVREVARAASRAVDASRAGHGPAFLECLTYRHSGHSRTDPGTYRPPDEVERWMARDPLLLARSALVDDLGFDDDEVEATASAAGQMVRKAVEQALAAPWPDTSLPVEEYRRAG